MQICSKLCVLRLFMKFIFQNFRYIHVRARRLLRICHTIKKQWPLVRNKKSPYWKIEINLHGKINRGWYLSVVIRKSFRILIATILKFFLFFESSSLFRMGLFGAAYRWGWAKKPPYLKLVIHVPQWWNLLQLYLNWRKSKAYINHVWNPLNSADIIILHEKSAIFAILGNKDKNFILKHNL